MTLLDDPSLYQDGIPHAAYDRVRAEHPIYYNSGEHPFYAVMSYADAACVLKDTACYSSAVQGILIEDVSAEVRPLMRAMLPFSDPPDHTELRQKLFAPLMPSNLARFKTLLESACEGLVEQAVRDGTIDFVDRLAAEVPIVALGLLLGLERGQLEPLRAPSDAIIDNGINNSAAALATLSSCLEELVVDRCQEPRDDYMTKLARVDFAERPMSMIERIGLLLQIVIGGLETTRSAMAGLLVALNAYRAQWETIRASPDLVGNAVEESLRYVSPINYLRRTTVRPATLGDVTLPAGSRVVVFLGAANRDPARFPQPHELDVRRTNARHHMALGTGPHVCMGAGLAKMELVAFWSAFVSRVTAFELLGPYERGRLIQQNVIRRLPVRLHAA